MAFILLRMGDLFSRVPDRRLIIPHGDGSVPYYRGLASADELTRDDILFDTCVHYQPGMDLLAETVPAETIIFSSDMIGRCAGSTRKPGPTTMTLRAS
ncbi:putative 4-oxalomesaconate hydratase [Oceanicola sp. S124]|uniref:putative 4-oxalomesaconate hydratase n=1 Tax=Oceanicola sp. S124 TaxID=1042378 RepID=UPI0002557A13|nr:putative 4-oxalomesaconate hydratase [Oceanicola sp. S124]